MCPGRYLTPLVMISLASARAGAPVCCAAMGRKPVAPRCSPNEPTPNTRHYATTPTAPALLAGLPRLDRDERTSTRRSGPVQEYPSEKSGENGIAEADIVARGEGDLESIPLHHPVSTAAAVE